MIDKPWRRVARRWVYEPHPFLRIHYTLTRCEEGSEWFELRMLNEPRGQGEHATVKTVDVHESMLHMFDLSTGHCYIGDNE